MRRFMLKSKIHRATLTGTELDYEGSVTVDQDLLDEADILPGEHILATIGDQGRHEVLKNLRLRTSTST